MIDLLPQEVRSKIATYLEEQCARGEAGWDAAEDEEDTLTGDLCGTLRKGWGTLATQNDGQWRWRVSYKKFGGRGKASDESILGADGIVQIEVEDKTTKKITNKGLLFQAKKVTSKDRNKLVEQIRNMEAVARRGSAVFEYGPNGYRAADSSAVLKAEGRISDNRPTVQRLGEYLARRFLTCKIGRRGLFYDAVRRILVAPSENEDLVRYRAKLKHRLQIEVQRHH
jgi:hypothetical protein